MKSACTRDVDRTRNERCFVFVCLDANSVKTEKRGSVFSLCR